ncbi:hypothetical protein ACFQ9V_13205 [Leifsonia sp. NPDC056665]|uniref:hypothetical protein n=1 Tax=Leifsonia sp. NPDC056665 TaxID=3345901 RepID=UPI003696B68A
MPYEPIVPEGQHLGTSHQVGDAVTGHLFEDGTNELKGHASWRWVDEGDDASSTYEPEPPRPLTQEELELAAQVAALAAAFIVGVVIEATPHIKRWWSGKAVPAVMAKWKRIASAGKAKRATAAPSAPSERATFVGSATGVELAVSESKIEMTGDEWEHRFRAMLAAGAFSAEQYRILSTARVQQNNSELEAVENATLMTPQEFADQIKAVLEANPALLSKETSSEMIRIFSSPSMSSNQRGLA